MRVLILSLGKLAALSTITCEGLRRPFFVDGFTEMRVTGARRNSLVIGKTVTDGCSENKSDWMINAGRGLP